MRSSRVPKILIGLALLPPFLRSLKDIVTGIIPFWVDPALDFLLALENLSKPRLIGQPSGVVGIFYGPYTVWLTSLVLVISKDPRVTVFLLHTLPYFTIFPFLLFRVFDAQGTGLLVSLWLLFILSYRNYTTYLWSPHHAPLLLLWLVYLVVSLSRRSRWRSVGVGLLAGLVANFHIAFGMAVVASTLLWYLLPPLLKLLGLGRGVRRGGVRELGSFFLVSGGLLLAFLPSILFEVRHDFLQSRALLDFLSDLVQGRNLSQPEGLGKWQIVSSFLSPLARLFLLPPQATPFLYGVVILASSRLWVKGHPPWSETEKRLGRFLVLLSLVTLGMYLSLDIPIWHYHFIGMETILLLALGLVSAKSRLLRRLVIGATLPVVLFSIVEAAASLKHDPLAVPSLAAKRLVVETILADAPGGEFAVSVYSPSLFTYDYDYLFSWIASERGLQPPSRDVSENGVVYLVIPEADPKVEASFIQSTTPEERFRTIREWRNPDNTLVVKRQLQEERTP